MVQRLGAVLLFFLLCGVYSSCKKRSDSSVSSADGKECAGVSLGSCERRIDGINTWKRTADEHAPLEIFYSFFPARGGLRWQLTMNAAGKKQTQILAGSLVIPFDDRLIFKIEQSTCWEAPGVSHPNDTEALQLTLAYAHAFNAGEHLYLRRWADVIGMQSWEAHRSFVRNPSSDPKVYVGKGYQQYIPFGKQLPPQFELGCFRWADDFVKTTLREVKSVP